MRFLLSILSTMPFLHLVGLYKEEASHNLVSCLPSSLTFLENWRAPKFPVLLWLTTSDQLALLLALLQRNWCRWAATECKDNNFIIIYYHWNHLWWFQKAWRSLQLHWWVRMLTQQPSYTAEESSGARAGALTCLALQCHARELWGAQGKHHWHADGSQERRWCSCPSHNLVLHPIGEESAQTVQEVQEDHCSWSGKRQGN